MAAFNIFVRPLDRRITASDLRLPPRVSGRAGGARPPALFELCAMHATGPTPCDARVAQDTDGSGLIDAKEMRRMMFNLGENMSVDQVDEILRLFDQDGDGQISPEEFGQALIDEKLLGTKVMK